MSRWVTSALLVLLFPLAAEATVYTSEIVGPADPSHSLALDAQGNPVIAAVDQSELKIFRREAQGWVGETVDAGALVTPSLALDSEGNVHVCYFDGSLGGLKYAENTSGSWTIEIVDAPLSGGQTGLDPSIAVDSNNHPHVAYTNNEAGGRVRYAKRGGNSWNIRAILYNGIDEIGSHPSLTLTADDEPRISYYYYDNAIRWAKKLNGQSWFAEYVTNSGFGKPSDIGVTSTGELHVALYNAYYTDLMERHTTGGTWGFVSWVDETPSNVGGYLSMVMDSQDRAHIAYFDATNFDLKLTSWNGSAWEFETVASAGQVGAYCQLALDAGDAPHFSYYDYNNEVIRYSTVAQTTGIEDPGDTRAGLAALRPPVPNPLPATRGRVQLSLTVPRDSRVDFVLVDVSGRRVAERVETLTAGDHEMDWALPGISRGMYFLKMAVEGGTSRTVKLTVL